MTEKEKKKKDERYEIFVGILEISFLEPFCHELINLILDYGEFNPLCPICKEIILPRTSYMTEKDRKKWDHSKELYNPACSLDCYFAMR